MVSPPVGFSERSRYRLDLFLPPFVSSEVETRHSPRQRVSTSLDTNGGGGGAR
ncbi:hypothetical protein [Novosphingobium sp. 9]|uniref:hypothetical protein n=1 Tax=Novosphingobium sp. 9 TaxID=2025349 RepID=UPI0021B5C837|nr:hypothetical protein [Novosphingobium sp. 9]